MKKLFLLSCMLVSISMMAQQPVITFEKTTHDFGKINEADGRVTTVFEFTNEGMVPLVLTNVRASCVSYFKEKVYFCKNKKKKNDN